jgi:hypothetical protein
MQIEANDFENPEASKILKEYFRDNMESLWEDALKDHDLI